MKDKLNKVRTEDAINADLTAALDSYRSGVETDTIKESKAKTDKVKELQAELAASFIAGAKLCKDGSVPHGMRINKYEVEIGCTTDAGKPTFTPIEGDEAGRYTKTYEASRNTADKVVADWNNGVYYSKIVGAADVPVGN